MERHHDGIFVHGRFGNYTLRTRRESVITLFTADSAGSGDRSMDAFRELPSPGGRCDWYHIRL